MGNTYVFLTKTKIKFIINYNERPQNLKFNILKTLYGGLYPVFQNSKSLRVHFQVHHTLHNLLQQNMEFVIVAEDGKLQGKWQF